MSFPYWTPNFADCPECDGRASDKDHPENWFTCECGHGFSKKDTVLEPGFMLKEQAE